MDEIRLIELLSNLREIINRSLSLTEKDAQNYDQELKTASSRLSRYEQEIYSLIITAARHLEILSIMKVALEYCKQLISYYLGGEPNYDKIVEVRQKIITQLEKLESVTKKGGEDV